MARDFRELDDDFADKDNFSADTKGERRWGLLEGDRSFLFCDCLLSLTDFFFEGGGDDFLDNFSGDSFLGFFEADFSEELTVGLPLFLGDERSSAGLAKPLS